MRSEKKKKNDKEIHKKYMWKSEATKILCAFDVESQRIFIQWKRDESKRQRVVIIVSATQSS